MADLYSSYLSGTKPNYNELSPIKEGSITHDPFASTSNAVDPSGAYLNWSSQTPDVAWYSPTNMGIGHEVNADLLMADPLALQMVQSGSETGGPQSEFYQSLLNQVPDTYLSAAQSFNPAGSSHTLAPEFGGEEELGKRLSGMFLPK